MPLGVDADGVKSNSLVMTTASQVLSSLFRLAMACILTFPLLTGVVLVAFDVRVVGWLFPFDTGTATFLGQCCW